MLLLLGGARRPYETTLRVSAYASGATSVLGLIPLCGAFIGGIYAVVVAIIGLSRAHEISTGKAAAAVLLPIVLCCGLVLLFYGAIAAIVFGALVVGSAPVVTVAVWRGRAAALDHELLWTAVGLWRGGDGLAAAPAAVACRRLARACSRRSPAGRVSPAAGTRALRALLAGEAVTAVRANPLVALTADLAGPSTRCYGGGAVVGVWPRLRLRLHAGRARVRCGLGAPSRWRRAGRSSWRTAGNSWTAGVRACWAAPGDR